MNISLSAQLESWIQEKIESGNYSSASEVVREALRLLKEQESIRAFRLSELKKQIKAGLTDIENGETVSFDKGLIEKVKKEGRARLRRKR